MEDVWRKHLGEGWTVEHDAVRATYRMEHEGGAWFEVSALGVDHLESMVPDACDAANEGASSHQGQMMLVRVKETISGSASWHTWRL